MLKSILSFRHTTYETYKFIMDNDDYTNTHRGLPITILKFETIVFHFYNFKYTPPSRVSVEISSEDFKNNPRCITRKIPEIESTITIYYSDCVKIVSIILTVQNFLKSVRKKT